MICSHKFFGKSYYIPSYSASLTSTLTRLMNDGGFLSSYSPPRPNLICDFMFLKKATSPYSSVTEKIVCMEPMMPKLEDTNASTPEDDSRRLYVTLALENNAGSNAPIFNVNTSSLEGSELNTADSSIDTEHKQASSCVIEHALWKSGCMCVVLIRCVG